MKLYLIHAGYYDPEIMKGLYEQHVNYFVAAENIRDAKNKARKNSMFVKKRMHIDGIQELNVIDGYRVQLMEDNSPEEMINYGYEDVKKIK